MFGASAVWIVLPGLSITFTDVSIGPWDCLRSFLSPLAKVDPGVVGTITVAVSPPFRNQVDLSSLVAILLSSLFLYSGVLRFFRLSRLSY